MWNICRIRLTMAVLFGSGSFSAAAIAPPTRVAIPPLGSSNRCTLDGRTKPRGKGASGPSWKISQSTSSAECAAVAMKNGSQLGMCASPDESQGSNMAIRNSGWRGVAHAPAAPAPWCPVL